MRGLNELTEGVVAGEGSLCTKGGLEALVASSGRQRSAAMILSGQKVPDNSPDVRRGRQGDVTM